MDLYQKNQKESGAPTILVIFGATGDLIAKKIAPALYHLFLGDNLPKLFTIVGSARKQLSDEEFRDYIKTLLIDKGETIDEQTSQFLAHFIYQRAEFSNEDDYKALAQKLGRIDGQWKTCANKLFYLAVPPQNYELMFNQLAASGLTIPCSPEEGWTRVIVEKPFGENFQTAQELDSMLGSLFKEEQIYRIDHYLAKEMLQNILIFRFTNNLLEKIWSKESIESIEIRLFEKIGVENRGAFYDKVGALRDVGQNHILQMLALTTMENPLSFEADAVRKNRAKILAKLPVFSTEQIKENTLRAQYEGYTAIADVDPHSKTETYFKLAFSLDDSNWDTVPITVEGGKRLKEARKEIVVTIKHPKPCLCPVDGGHIKNKITISMEPAEEIKIKFWSKKPGLKMEIQEADFDFVYQQSKKGTQYTQEYEKLLLDCIHGNQLLFVSTQEVQTMWKFVDPIVEAWNKDEVPLKTYPVDTLPQY